MTCPCEEKAAEALWRQRWPNPKWKWSYATTAWGRAAYRKDAAIARAAMGHVCDDCPERKT